MYVLLSWWDSKSVVYLKKCGGPQEVWWASRSVVGLKKCGEPQEVWWVTIFSLSLCVGKRAVSCHMPYVKFWIERQYCWRRYCGRRYCGQRFCVRRYCGQRYCGRQCAEFYCSIWIFIIISWNICCHLYAGTNVRHTCPYKAWCFLVRCYREVYVF